MSDPAMDAAIAVLDVLAGAASTAAPLIPNAAAQLAMRGTGAALGLVASLLRHGQEPVVQIREWARALDAVLAADHEVDDRLGERG